MIGSIVILVGLLAAATAVALILVALRPGTFRVARSISIRARPEAVFKLIEDFHRWRAWSPWENRDPHLQRSYTGAERGPGATYAWAGDRRVGEGRMEIIEAVQQERLSIRLDFLKPFAATNTAEFALVPDGEGTAVTWSMFGPSPFTMRLIGLFVSMDKMVGKDFEAGLRALKELAEI